MKFYTTCPTCGKDYHISYNRCPHCWRIVERTCERGYTHQYYEFVPAQTVNPPPVPGETLDTDAGKK